MRTSNPVLKQRFFQGARVIPSQGAMTVQGTVNKTGVLAIILFVSAFWTWNRTLSDAIPGQPLVSGLMLVGLIGGLIVALITIFKASWAPITAPIYAALEGLFLGGISAYFERSFPGLPFQAILLTVATLASMLIAYKMGLIQATEGFKRGVLAATGGIMLVYLLTLVLGLFGVGIPYLHGSGLIGIGFSLFVVIIAALNLVLDFDLIESGAESGAPKYMEWYGAFALTVTLVWLYLEILRLLAKLRGRN